MYHEICSDAMILHAGLCRALAGSDSRVRTHPQRSRERRRASGEANSASCWRGGTIRAYAPSPTPQHPPCEPGADRQPERTRPQRPGSLPRARDLHPCRDPQTPRGAGGVGRRRGHVHGR